MTHRRSGFLLVEILYVVAAYAAVALLAVYLFGMTLRAISQADAAHDRLAAVVALEQALQRDLWTASRFEVAGDQRLTIHRTQGPAIQWQIDAEQALVRQIAGDPSSQRRWPELGQQVRFEREGPALAVEVARGPQTTGERLRLYPLLPQEVQP